MIIGAAGSGKTTVVNTLVTLIRNMFGYRNAIQVFAATGATAAAGKCKTIHKGLQISMNKRNNKKPGLSGMQRVKLMKDLEHTLVVVLDEFSMISAEMLKQARTNCQATAHKGNNSNVPWGGIPIIILSGHAIQFPSILPGICNFGLHRHHTVDTMEGMEEFMQFQDNVTMLNAGKRQRSGQTEFSALLQHARNDTLNEDHATALKITESAVYLYVSREKVKEKNSQRLYDMSCSINPVARMHCSSFKREDHQRKAIALHFSSIRDDSIETSICKNATMRIEGQNFMPQWGLDDHADGRVVDIVYSKDKNSKKGDLPDYVVVHINDYCGPVWDKSNPKYVPIPVTEIGCDFGCCERQYIPLKLAFGRTVGSFKGKSAGPTDEGRQKNTFQHLIVDVDDLNSFPHLFYVALSRATTIGDHNGKGSAIYFQNNCLSIHRLTNTRKRKPSCGQTMLEKVRKRNIFLNKTEESSKRGKLTEEIISEVEDWISVSQFSKLDIQREIDTRIHKWDG